MFGALMISLFVFFLFFFLLFAFFPSIASDRSIGGLPLVVHCIARASGSL